MIKSINWSNTEVLITGGTGTLGRELTRQLLTEYHPKGVRIFSRGEVKQYNMKQELQALGLLGGVAFLIGDVRDQQRVEMAMRGVHVVIHTAAIKQTPVAEDNPLETIKTNVTGSQNVLQAALGSKVRKVMLISTDKAVHPANLYGASKMCAERLFVQGNVYSGGCEPYFSVCRYGNVMGSRGSVIPLFKQQAGTGAITITDKLMSRFWITIRDAARFILNKVEVMRGGEIFVPKLPSCCVSDIAMAVAPGTALEEIGVRPGEKLHECLISEEESRNVVEHPDCYVVMPPSEHLLYGQWKPFIYDSENNPRKITDIGEIKELINEGGESNGL